MDPASGDVAFLVYDRVVYAPPPPYSHVYDANGKLRISGVLPPDVLAIVAGAESNESKRAGPAVDFDSKPDPETVNDCPSVTGPVTALIAGTALASAGHSATHTKNRARARPITPPSF